MLFRINFYYKHIENILLHFLRIVLYTRLRCFYILI